MTSEETPPSLDGLAIDEAVDAVVGAHPDRDPERVRTTLDRVTEDGVVRADAVEDALAHTAKVVATPETRVERASMALDDARETGSDVTDRDLVASRFDDFEGRLATLEQRVADLGERLQGLVDADGGLYAVAREIREVTTEANAVQYEADELASEIAEFEQWLADASVRHERLAGDVEALETTVDGLAATVEAVETAVDEDSGVVSLPEAGDVERDAAWFDATVRHRMAGLLLADMTAEAATLRDWPGDAATDEGDDENDTGTDGLDELEGRIETLERRHDDVGERLEALARPDWTVEFGEQVSAVEARFERMDPPVDWEEVRAVLDDHHTILE